MRDLRELVGYVGVACLAFIGGGVIGMIHARSGFELERKLTNEQFKVKYEKLVAANERESNESKERIRRMDYSAKQEELNAKLTIEKLRSNISNRVVRVSVPVASCTANTDTSDRTVTAGNGQAQAELLPKTVLDLVSIVADANSEVRRTNFCIDRYNDVKERLERLQRNRVD